VVAPADNPARPWLTVVEDDHSRAIAGHAVNLGAPSALQSALVLRQAIWRKAEPGWHVCGIPGVFYTDHGSGGCSPCPATPRAAPQTAPARPR
jgi:putative transposase